MAGRQNSLLYSCMHILSPPPSTLVFSRNLFYFSIQAVVQIAIFTVFLTMFAQTFLYQAGLYSILLSRFRTFFAVGFINFGSLLAIRIFRIV